VHIVEQTATSRSRGRRGSVAAPQEPVQNTKQQPVTVVASILEDYARRGVFAAYRPTKTQAQKADFLVQWHFRQILTIRLDATKGTLSLVNFLPHASAVPNIRRELAAFLRRSAAADRPSHRRIDPMKARVSCDQRKENISLRFNVLDDDYEYATRKLVHLVNEIFLDFLREAHYVEYMVTYMNMNPETGGSL